MNPNRWRRHRWLLLGLILAAVVLLFYPRLGRAPARDPVTLPEEGIRLSCASSLGLASAQTQMADYLAAEGIAQDWLRISKGPRRLIYTLATPLGDTSTLDLQSRPLYRVADVAVRLPAGAGRWRESQTVSRKEILLALMQHGRVTEFHGKDCGLSELQRQVALRQNIVAWAWHLSWVWPDGDAAEWNGRYWNRGTPRPGVPLSKAVQDAFVRQERYAIGCYTATKLTLVQAVLDFYGRVRPDEAALKRVESRLLTDGEPLLDIEPGRLWEFESGFDPAERTRAGKITALQEGVAARNFVPGDWVVFVNTDPVSYAKTGYEGSNAIYLGGGRFDDYYNDHHHAYTYDEKLDEVYQWRNGVFSRIRDADKRQWLSAADFDRLAGIPEAGGLVLDKRVVPAEDMETSAPEPDREPLRE